jgi:hypothetical protein
MRGLRLQRWLLLLALDWLLYRALMPLLSGIHGRGSRAWGVGHGIESRQRYMGHGLAFKAGVAAMCGCAPSRVYASRRSWLMYY